MYIKMKNKSNILFFVRLILRKENVLKTGDKELKKRDIDRKKKRKKETENRHISQTSSHQLEKWGQTNSNLSFFKNDNLTSIKFVFDWFQSKIT
jgi:hypothetical protein